MTEPLRWQTAKVVAITEETPTAKTFRLRLSVPKPHLAGQHYIVRLTAPEGLAEWRYHGRLVARQLDDAHLVIRADFDYRDPMLRQFPETFSVPARYVKHMMVVADLARGDAGAIEEALEAAWQLQRSAG